LDKFPLPYKEIFHNFDITKTTLQCKKVFKPADTSTS
jgi:hypothetical protein